MAWTNTEMASPHAHQIEYANHFRGTGQFRREPRPGGDYCPTPEEIAAECRKIQSEWSERERWRRAGYTEGRPLWEVPTHQLASLAGS
ncbi:MAG TPA: hypothetical protein VML55_09410 [Planctomycetaceae bacterium]|nr:hypothetical protein [Planctomycetaceae bacterium]